MENFNGTASKKKIRIEVLVFILIFADDKHFYSHRRKAPSLSPDVSSCRSSESAATASVVIRNVKVHSQASRQMLHPDGEQY